MCCTESDWQQEGTEVNGPVPAVWHKTQLFTTYNLATEDSSFFLTHLR